MSASQATLVSIFYKTSLKFGLANLNIWFTSECIRRKVTPTFINIKCKSSSFAASKATAAARSTWLQWERTRWFATRDRLSLQKYELSLHLAAILHPAEWETLLDTVKSRVFRICSHRKEKQVSKLERMVRSQTRSPTKVNQTVSQNHPNFFPRIVNLSSSTLNHNESALLQKGLKHSPVSPPNSNSLKNMCIHMDNTLSNDAARTETKHAVTQTIKQHLKHSTHSQLSSSDVTTAKQLKAKITQENLTVTKADKGNSIVILDKEDYNKKVQDFINTNEISSLKTDPTNTHLTTLKQELNESKALFPYPQRFLPRNPLPPRLYGLPKIHKPAIPIRPVVSYTNTLTHRIAHKLNRDFRQHVHYTSQHTILNSVELISKIKDTPVPANAKLVSFDVSSLFPSIPTSECKDLLKDIIDKSSCAVPIKTELFNLISLCIDANYFKFNDIFYKQDSGLPMGSPLSPLLADIFMDNWENNLFQSRHPLLNNLVYWHRYVDDILALWTGTHRQLNIFTQFINSLHANINLTTEIEDKHRSLNFLDLTITLVNDHHEFNIYRKPTHTDTIIHNTSQHPPAHKHAAFRTMIHRLFSVPMSPENTKKEINTIKHIATMNGYNSCLIDKIIHRKMNTINIQKHTSLTPIKEHTETKYITIPYVGPLSLKIAATLKKFNIRTTFQTQFSLQKTLSNNKDPIPTIEQCGVYALTCNNCNAIYIGQTGRKFIHRIKEHERAWRKQTPSLSHFADHLTDNQHTFNRNTNFHILEIENRYWHRMKLETLHIHTSLSNNNTVTLNQNIPEISSPLLKLAHAVHP